MRIKSYIDVFAIDLESVSILDCHDISSPVNGHFLFDFAQRDRHFDSLYLLFNGWDVWHCEIIDGVDDSITVVGDKSVEELWLGCQH